MGYLCNVFPIINRWYYFLSMGQFQPFGVIVFNPLRDVVACRLQNLGKAATDHIQLRHQTLCVVLLCIRLETSHSAAFKTSSAGYTSYTETPIRIRIERNDAESAASGVSDSEGAGRLVTVMWLGVEELSLSSPLSWRPTSDSVGGPAALSGLEKSPAHSSSLCIPLGTASSGYPGRDTDQGRQCLYSPVS